MTGDKLYSFLIAQVLGLYLFITALAALSRASYYRKLIADYKGLDYSGVYAVLCALLIGLFLALTQNSLVNRNQVVVTVVAWSILIKAIWWIFVPEKALFLMQRLAAGRGYYVANIIFLVVGLIMINKAFYLFALFSGAFS